MTNPGWFKQVFTGDDGLWSLKRLLTIPLMGAMLSLHVAMIIVFFRVGESPYIRDVMPYFVPMATVDAGLMTALLGIAAYLTAKSPAIDYSQKRDDLKDQKP